MFRYKLKKEVIENIPKIVKESYIEEITDVTEKIVSKSQNTMEAKVAYTAEAIANNDPYVTSEEAIPTTKDLVIDSVTGLPVVTKVIKVFYKNSHFLIPISWIEETNDLPENLVWGPDKYRIVSFMDYLLNQIRVRYAFFDRPKSGLMNVVMDSYMPKIMYTSKFNTANLTHLKLPKTTYCISPWFASIIGSHQITAEQLCRVLGYTTKDIKQLITKAKANNYSITFVGYGGTNVNTIHWLTEMMKFTNSVNLFKFIEIVEPENLEISNFLRFPIHPEKVPNNAILGQWTANKNSKLRLLDKTSLTLLSKNKTLLLTNMLTTPDRDYNLQGLVYNDAYNRLTEKSCFYKANNKHIFYGAPSISTRHVMSTWGNFIAATHTDDRCQLWLNPTLDTDLQVESYGLISLTQFFMNQLRMAIGLLEVMANNTDLSQVDIELMNYSFDGISKLPTDRSYNFQIVKHSGTVATEEEARTAF